MAAKSSTKRSSRAGSKPRRAYHHGNLRRALIDEALETIRAEGVQALTLREIGARVGVSRTALYRHFSDKGALLAAVATEGFRTLREQLLAAWKKAGQRDEAFRAMGVAYVRFALDNPSHYRVMFGGHVEPKAGEVPNPELVTEAQGAFQALVDAVASLQRDGILRDDDTLMTSRYIWALVHGVAMLGIDGRLYDQRTVETLTEYALERLLTGLQRPR